jgi:hypothetical protein
MVKSSTPLLVHPSTCALPYHSDTQSILVVSRVHDSIYLVLLEAFPPFWSSNGFQSFLNRSFLANFAHVKPEKRGRYGFISSTAGDTARADVSISAGRQSCFLFLGAVKLTSGRLWIEKMIGLALQMLRLGERDKTG